MNQTGRRKKIRTISFLTALILTLGIWGASENIKERRYARIITASRQQALSDLGTYMDHIETSLTKGLYCGTAPMLAGLASSLWRESTGAKTSLSHLGDAETHLLGTYKFLSQVGDYTMYLNRKLAAGGEITEEEYANLEKLRDYAAKYAQQIGYMQELMYGGGFSFDEIDLSLLDDGADVVNFSDAASDSEQNVSDYPTLIYDGPFSDNIDSKRSVFLEGKPEVSEQQAKNTAASFLGMKPETLESLGEQAGNLPCYLFSAEDKTVAVTKNGGVVRYLLSGAYAGEEKTDAKDAVKAGVKFLEKNGYRNMRDSYYSVSDGIATVNYAYYENDVCCYTDLIKVGVSLADGTVVSFDATGYLMNHSDARRLTAPVDVSEAQSKVSPALRVQSHKPALIPTDGGGEIETVEFLCKSEEGDDVLVYIDPQTLTEKEILLLTYSDNGILTR